MVSGFDLSKIEATLNRVKGFDNMVAQVGVPQGPTYDNGKSVAYVAAIQEFGYGVHARPFFHPAIKKNKLNWAKTLGKCIPKVIAGKESPSDSLNEVGSQAQLAIQTEIINLYAPALSPITVLLRKWRKGGEKISGKTVGKAARAIADGVDPGSDDKLLIDDGILISSIDHAVNRKGSEFTV